MLLNNQQVTEEMEEKIKNYMETHKNGTTTIKNLWDITKAILRRLW